MSKIKKSLKRAVAFMLVILVCIQSNSVYGTVVDNKSSSDIEYDSKTTSENVSEQKLVTEAETDNTDYKMEEGTESEEADTEETETDTEETDTGVALNLLNENNEGVEESLEQGQQVITARNVININSRWNFKSNDTTTKGWEFPNGKGEGIVDLPHSWEYVHPTMSYIPQMNKKTVTYEKTLDISQLSGKNYFIKFYGSSRNTEVLIDGESVGTHIGGYSAFVFNITNYVKEKSSITITVNVTNMDTESIPINVDYTQWAGIYRDVELITTDDQYISMEDYGSEGIYIDTNINGENADVKCKTEVSNLSTENKSIVLRTEILSNDGNTVCQEQKKYDLKANTVNQSLDSNYKIEKAHLWNGTKDPYLYTMKVSVLDQNGNLLDEKTQKFGVRSYEIKNGKFYLNGKEYEVHGVGLHQDREGYGNAVPNDLKTQDMDIMQEMGVNAIRTAHYPHDQYVYNMADERGIIVYCEIPYYLLLSNAQSYKDSIKEQLKEMIRQEYNHPSIMMWGILNEVYQSDRFASFGSDFKVDEQTLIDFNKELADIAQQEDTTRYIVQAEIDTKEANKVASKWSKNGKVDFTGVNIYVGFKSDVPNADDTGRALIRSTLAEKVDEYKKTYNTSSILITEYGAGANIEKHTTVDGDFSWNSGDQYGSNHYEEYQSYILETYYDFIQQRNDIPMSFVWNMFDFSCYRNEGGLPRTNTKGLVCYDHSTKKDAFYFYKANWNKEDKFVYLTSKRYTERDGKVQQLKVYSNCDSVELFVNGKSIGNGRKQQSGVFVWDDVLLSDTNSIKAVGTANGKKYSDSVDEITANNRALAVSYKSHVQNIGWQSNVKDGKVSGTTGEKKQIEALQIKLLQDRYSGSIEYRTHVQNIGWQEWVKDGATAGTTGRKLRVEALQIGLTGEWAEHYDIYYRVHAQNYGWLGWTKNGAMAGTTGKSYRLEAVQIVVVEKGSVAPSASLGGCVSNNTKAYIADGQNSDTISVGSQAHVQNVGWQNKITDGNISGTVGKSLRLEAIKLSVENQSCSGTIKYQTHVQNIGWQSAVTSGAIAGTTGKALRIEAININLTGELANRYDVYYRVHAQNYGWMNWAKNGENAGTVGKSLRIEGIQVVLVKKGQTAPDNSYGGVITKNSYAYIEK